VTSVRDILGRLRGVRKSGAGWIARCPAHDDRKASLSISLDDSTAKILIHCHAGCSPEEICRAAGIEVRDLFLNEGRTLGRHSKVARKLVARHDYVDEAGTLLFQVLRFDPKGFSQRRPDGAGGWINNLDGTRRILYNLQEVIAAERVWIVEGEKDVETACSLRLTATCNPGGAGKWRPEYADTLAGKEIIIVPDADEPGRKHAQQIAASLIGKARSVRLVELGGAKDLSEWHQRGGTRQQLLDLISSTPECTPPPLPDGLSLLRELEQFISGFVVLPPYALLAIVLWAIATNVFEIFDAFPFLILSSPAPRCGKTRTLEVLELIVARPKRTANVSEAALFRLADSAHPTFLLDEQETLSGKTERAEALRGLLNAGHRRGSKATRCTGANRDEVREFDVFGPKVLAGIGDFSATLRDRAVVVVMQRRQASQSVTRFIYRIASQHAATLKTQIEAWCSHNQDRIRAAYEAGQSVQFLSDREEENWSPLFSVLVVADPSRFDELRTCAEALSRRKAEADDEQTQTLEILRHALEIWPASEPALASTQLIHRLCLKEDAPTFKPSDGGRPEVELSPRRFARMVRLFGVRPINLRWEGRVRKGYQRGPLEAALAPYLSNLSATTATQPVNEELGPDFPSATTGSVAHALLSETPTKESHVADVADKSVELIQSSCGDDQLHDGCTEGEEENDTLYQRALQLATESDEISISLLKEALGVSASRAIQLLDRMEYDGIVGSAHGPGPRMVLKQLNHHGTVENASLLEPSLSRYQPEPLAGGGWCCECGVEGNDSLEWSKHTGAGGCPLKAPTPQKPSKHNFGKPEKAG
jgi:hypothetical protein